MRSFPRLEIYIFLLYDRDYEYLTHDYSKRVNVNVTKLYITLTLWLCKYKFDSISYFIY